MLSLLKKCLYPSMTSYDPILGPMTSYWGKDIFFTSDNIDFRIPRSILHKKSYLVQTLPENRTDFQYAPDYDIILLYSPGPIVNPWASRV